MPNFGKWFRRFTNIYKMSNAYASSFGRYIKWLNKWYTIYEKNVNFLFKLTFLRKSGRIEKNWNSFAEASPEKQTLLINQTFNNCSAPTYYFLFKKIDLHLISKREAHKTKHSIVPRVALHIPLYVSTVYTRLEVKDICYGWGSY